MPTTEHADLPRRSTDERGRAIPLTEEQARRRAEEAIRALDVVYNMGDEEEQRATLERLMGAEDGASSEPQGSRG